MNRHDQKDRYGFTFGELLQIQNNDLTRWRPLLRPEVFESTKAVCEAMNAPAADSTRGLHTVPRGSQLAQIILDFPRHGELLAAAMME